MGVHYGKANFITYGKPSLFLDFANKKSLVDRISGNNLITFTRTSTGTYVGADGLIKTAAADEPRFDHDPVTGESLGLLIEEQRANLCTQSVNFNFSATSNITETTVFNPDGTAAIRRTPLSTANFHGTGANTANIDITNLADGGTTDVTTSIFVRNYNNSNLRLLIGFVAFDATPIYRYFLTTINTANPTSLGVPSGIGWSNGATKVENYGNGWYRYTFSGTYTKVTGYNTIAFVGEQIHSSTGQQFWNGDDVSGIYTWGIQRELGLFSTSYIPTSGSTVTRTADNASITGTNFSDWYNQSEGSIYCSYKNNTTDFTSRKNVYTIQGTSSGIELRSPNIGANRLRFVFNGGFNSNPSQFSATLNQRKTAFSYDQSQHNGCIDGILATHDEEHTNDNTKNILCIGNRVVNVADYLCGTISQLTYYPVRLSNEVLQTLTK